jgi:ABC-type polysaccharide transport system, permease component
MIDNALMAKPRGRSGAARRAWTKMKRSRYLYLLIALPLVYFFLFKYLPIYGVVIAFKDFDVFKGILGSDWVGLRYFKEAFLDPDFWPTFWNSISLSLLTILFSFPAPILLAISINELRGSRYKRFIESVSCFPHFISMVAVVSILLSFVERDGIVNHAIQALGEKPISFMLEPRWFRPLYIITDIWKEIGWNSIIYLAAISTIDVEMYEACDIDGAGRIRRILSVTLPAIMPTVVIMLILRIGSIMTLSFEKVLLMQNPVIYSTADIIDTYVYRRGLVGSQFSYATAIGLFQSIIGLVFILATNAIARKTSETSLW